MPRPSLVWFLGAQCWESMNWASWKSALMEWQWQCLSWQQEDKYRNHTMHLPYLILHRLFTHGQTGAQLVESSASRVLNIWWEINRRGVSFLISWYYFFPPWGSDVWPHACLFTELDLLGFDIWHVVGVLAPILPSGSGTQGRQVTLTPTLVTILVGQTLSRFLKGEFGQVFIWAVSSITLRLNIFRSICYSLQMSASLYFWILLSRCIWYIPTGSREAPSLRKIVGWMALVQVLSFSSTERWA